MRQVPSLLPSLATVLLLNVIGLRDATAQQFGPNSNSIEASITQTALEVQSSAGSNSSPLESIPFELYGNLILIRIRVNRSEPLTFIVDSGAGVSFFNLTRAFELGLKLEDLGERGSFGLGEGKTKLAVTKGVSFGLGSLNWSGNVLVLPFDEQEAMIGEPIFGVLGYEFFSRYVVAIDFDASVIKIYDPKDYLYSGAGQALAVKVRDNVAFVRASVTPSGLSPIEGDFEVDTGNAGPLLLTSPFVKKYNLIQNPQSDISINGGIGGEMQAATGRLRAFQLGTFVFEKPPVLFSRASKGFSAENYYVGNLGGSILSRFRIVFDYNHRQMIVEPRANLTEPIKEDMSGVVLITGGKDLRTIRVRQVFENSPGSEAGLRADDVILAIDEKSVSELRLVGIRKLFTNAGQAYHLVVKRGDEKLQVVIRTRSWF